MSTATPRIGRRKRSTSSSYASTPRSQSWAANCRSETSKEERKTMSKRLIDEVRRQGGELSTKDAARRAIEAVTGAIDRITNEGERVTIQGFGTFAQKQRNE